MRNPENGSAGLADKEKTERKKHLTYNPDFDSRRYAALNALKSTDPEAYQAKKNMLDAETLFNQKTTLGERFNAALSRRHDRVIDGVLYGQHSDEPLLTMFERGRDNRFADSSDHDRAREAAEVAGFAKIQAVLGDPDTPIGTMMLSFSPPGEEDSQYDHNFYDIFALQEVNGERTIEVTRYSSALNRGEYIAHAATLQRGYFKDYETLNQSYDSYLLSRPLRINSTGRFKTAKELHALLQKDHETMSEEEYEFIIHETTPLMLAYLNTLAENPWALTKRNLSLNAIFNGADLSRERYRQSQEGQIIFSEDYHRPMEWKEIERLGRLPVREVETGCGFSGGFAVENSFMGSSLGSMVDTPGLFSVIDVGGQTDRYGKLTFKCPHCNHENKRPYGRLIKYCQSGTCRKDVSC